MMFGIKLVDPEEARHRLAINEQPEVRLDLALGYRAVLEQLRQFIAQGDFRARGAVYKLQVLDGHDPGPLAGATMKASEATRPAVYSAGA